MIYISQLKDIIGKKFGGKHMDKKREIFSYKKSMG